MTVSASSRAARKPPEVANFYEKARFVKVDLTIFACRRSRLRQCPEDRGWLKVERVNVLWAMLRDGTYGQPECLRDVL